MTPGSKHREEKHKSCRNFYRKKRKTRTRTKLNFWLLGAENSPAGDEHPQEIEHSPGGNGHKEQNKISSCGHKELKGAESSPARDGHKELKGAESSPARDGHKEQIILRPEKDTKNRKFSSWR